MRYSRSLGCDLLRLRSDCYDTLTAASFVIGKEDVFVVEEVGKSLLCYLVELPLLLQQSPNLISNALKAQPIQFYSSFT